MAGAARGGCTGGAHGQLALKKSGSRRARDARNPAAALDHTGRALIGLSGKWSGGYHRIHPVGQSGRAGVSAARRFGRPAGACIAPSCVRRWGACPPRGPAHADGGMGFAALPRCGFPKLRLAAPGQEPRRHSLPRFRRLETLDVRIAQNPSSKRAFNTELWFPASCRTLSGTPHATRRLILASL